MNFLTDDDGISFDTVGLFLSSRSLYIQHNNKCSLNSSFGKSECSLITPILGEVEWDAERSDINNCIILVNINRKWFGYLKVTPLDLPTELKKKMWGSHWLPHRTTLIFHTRRKCNEVCRLLHSLEMAPQIYSRRWPSYMGWGDKLTKTRSENLQKKILRSQPFH